MTNGSRPLILNVDDYAPALYARTRILRGAGYEVREATNGRQALEMVRSLSPALVILDVNLPDASGISICQQIKSNPETTSVIVLQVSATAIAAMDRTRALEGGADGYLIQPAEPEELIASVRALLRLRRAETELDELQKVWTSVLAATNDAVLLIDGDLGIQAANDKAAALYGYPASALIGMRLADLRAPQARGNLRDQLRLAQEAGGLIYETDHVRKDGRVFPVEVSCKPLSEGEAARYVNAVRDLTERKRAETNLRFLSEASKRLASSLDIHETLASVTRLAVPQVADWCAIDLLTGDGLPELVEVAHVDPGKVEWARSLRKKTPVDLGAPRGLAHVLRTGQAEFYPEITDEFLKASARTPEELALARQVGYRAAMIVPLSSHEHTMGALTLVSAESGRTFTHSDLEVAIELGRRAGMAIENARLYEESQSAIRTRDIFVSVASHELKTPVTVIQGYAELLKRLVEDTVAAGGAQENGRLTIDERVLVQRVTRIHAASDRLTRLLNDLLDISRIQTGALELKREPVELVQLVSQVIQAAAEREHALPRSKPAVEIEFAPQCREVWGDWDRERIEEALINLLDNAYKYSPHGGAILVSLKPEHCEGEILPCAHLTVRDEGIGIPPEDQPRLFQPFMRAGNATRLNLPGTGLGLAITRELVERHAGRIWVESDWPARGTVFHVLLPATKIV